MMNAAVLMILAVLMPAKTWFAPAQKLDVTVKTEGEATLALTEFTGRRIEAKVPPKISGEQTVDLRQVFPNLSTPGTYVLFLLSDEGRLTDFRDTPLVISVRDDRRPGSPPGEMVTKVEPLRYGVMTTAQGEMTLAFYYDVAPHTVGNFQTLAGQGYFDGLTFHRIVPGFVIQGGDPKGDGTGGPGYQIDAEFNDRAHAEGVLSMARSGDPSEAPGIMPRSDFANSAGSQFFICLNYESTKQLDGRYTAFGRVVAGMEAARAIAQAPIADARTGRPQQPPVIQKVVLLPVTAQNNPYREMMNLAGPTPEE